MGALSNTATIASSAFDPDPDNNSATDTDALQPQTSMSITKTDGQTTEIPGTPVTYTIVVANAGPSSAPSVTIADTVPAALTSVSYTAVAGGGATGFTAAGSGSIADTVSMPPGSSVTYTLTATISPAATGSLVNTATVASSTFDPDTSNDTATDDDTLQPTADVSISKTVAPGVVQVGTSVTYTITVANAGPSHVPAAIVTDTFDTTLNWITWTCAAQGGATCTAAGSGNILDSVALPPGSLVTYTAKATPLGPDALTVGNTATVALPSGIFDPTTGDQTSTIALQVTGPIPALGTGGLVLLVLLIALAGAWIFARRQ